ncbi:MAG: glycosyltransferase involved in cell wall biosynthesis [Alloalcanivorax sp.]|mgnify:CR=1 FL=1|jgi:colanic acid/amylovoran biosynthesis glycosyltransferase
MPDIYYITASYPYGAGESFLQPEIDEWLRRGKTVSVIPTYARGKIRQNFSGECDPRGRRLFRLSYLFYGLLWLLIKPMAVIAIVSKLMHAPGKLPKNLLIMFKAFSTAWFVRRNPAAHLHAHWAGVSSTFALIVSRLTDIPWSLTCHRWDIYDNNLIAIKSRDAVFTRFISQRGMLDALKLGVDKDKVVVIHMGVSRERSTIQKTSPSATPAIFCAANLLEVKGHCYLIRALRLLRDAGITVTLHLFGDGPLRDKLGKYAQNQGVGDAVFFLGHRSQEELFAAYRAGAADIFVLPSIHVADGDHEGVPVSLIEAMSFGIPVISTKTGSIDELLPSHLGLTVPDKNPEMLADAIAKLLNDDNRYSEVSHTVSNLVSQYWTAEICIDSLSKLIFPESTG